MNTKSHPDSDVDANNENRHGDCTDPEQSPSTARYLSKRIGRLGAWLAARMKAHEDRVSSLRVYHQRRVDGPVTKARRKQ